MQNLPTHALRHATPPISSPARRSRLPRPCRGSGRDADTTPSLHCSSVVDGPNPPRSFASGVFPVCPDHVGGSCRGGGPPFLPVEKRETRLSQGRKKRLPKGSPHPFCTNHRKGWASQKGLGGSIGGHARQ